MIQVRNEGDLQEPVSHDLKIEAIYANYNKFDRDSDA